MAAQACTPWVHCAQALLCTRSACPFLVFPNGLLAVPRLRYLERGTLFYAAEMVLPSFVGGGEKAVWNGQGDEEGQGRAVGGHPVLLSESFAWQSGYERQARCVADLGLPEVYERSLCGAAGEDPREVQGATETCRNPDGQGGRLPAGRRHFPARRLSVAPPRR